MARIFTEAFEGGAAGDAVTTANTGFSTLTAGSTFTSSPVAEGSRALTASTPATAANRILSYNTGALRGLLFSTIYVYLPTLPPTEVYLGTVTAASAARASWRVNANGTVTIRNNLTAAHTSTWTVPAGEWIRFEWRIDNAAGQQQLRAYSQHSATPLWDSGNVAYNMGTFDIFATGIATAVANTTINLDWVALDGATWVGPAVVVTAPNVTFTRENIVRIDGATPGGTLTLTRISGPTVTITEPTPTVFEVKTPDPLTSDVVLRLAASNEAGSSSKDITISAAGSSRRRRLVWSGTAWT